MTFDPLTPFCSECNYWHWPDSPHLIQPKLSASAEALTPTSAGADAPASQPKEDSETKTSL